jgi:hypothetical protein
MNFMQPGNSFPQICVVSESIMQKVVNFAQDYIVRMDVSNHPYLLMSKGARSVERRPAAISGAAIILAAITDSSGLQKRRVR